MRIVTWNCRVGGFRRKAKHIAPLKPDILAVQEVEPLDNVQLLDGECQPTYRDRMSFPDFPRRSIGMFSYTDTKLNAVDLLDPMFSFRRYEAQRGNLTFNVVGVWPYATKSAKTSYRQAHDGIICHEKWIRERPTVVLGDFNNNASYKDYGWKELKELIDSLGLVSAYHNYFKEEFGKETRPTHFHSGKETHGIHLDYCFLPSAWVPHITKVEVGAYSDWNKISDHVPLIVDLDPPGTA